MKFNKIVTLGLAAAVMMSVVGCGGNEKKAETSADGGKIVVVSRER